MELLDATEPGRGTGRGASGPTGLSRASRRSRSYQERLECSQSGRRFLSVLIVAILAAVVLWNLPESYLRTSAEPVVEPVVNAVGLDQRWNLFAPDPPQRTFELTARIEYADGSLALWQPPRNDRWRKWMGTIRSSSSRRLWEPTAAWIAQHHDAGGRRTVRVELIASRRDLPAPGSSTQFQQYYRPQVFYTYDVPASEQS